MIQKHTPVLLKEVIKFLKPRSNDDFIDCTLGHGGHALEILRKTSPSGRLLAIDWDKNSLFAAQEKLNKFGQRVIFIRNNFKDLGMIARQNHFQKAAGILLDLGLSTAQIKDPQYGLSFQVESRLDMRIVPEAKISAYEVINNFGFKQLVSIFRQYGDEKKATPIALAILRERKKQKIVTTLQLAEIIVQVKPKNLEHIHPATQVFQALRIYVNQELDNLKQVLSESVNLLQDSGRIGIISFHSGEDRIVKNFFKENHRLDIITKKPITCLFEEQTINPKSRSAKMRVAEKSPPSFNLFEK